MATQTTNYGFNKDAGTDYYSIDKTNANLDLIDSTIKEIDNKAVANKFQTAGGTATAITLTEMVLEQGNSKTFIVSSDNNSAATTINGKPLYKPGTTTATKLIAGKAVTVWYNGTNFFIKASAEGDSVVGNVLAGKTFSNDDDTGLTGTMPNNGPVATETVNLTTEGAEYIIPAGYHSGLRKIKAVITGLIASVIKAGVTVGGILGTFTSDATATAAQMLSGAIAYVNGNKITGTIASKTAQTYNPSTAAQTIPAGQYLSGAQTVAATTGTAVVGDVLASKTFNSANGIGLSGAMTNYGAIAITPSASNQSIPAGYHNGSGYVAGDVDLISANILDTANIFGVQGSAVAGKRYASGTAVSGSVVFLQRMEGVTSSSANVPRVIVSGLTFKPRYVELTYSGDDRWLTIAVDSGTTGWDVFQTNGLSPVTSWQLDGTNLYMIQGGFAITAPANGYTFNWRAVE
jgi:hypothetical protein